MWTSDLCYSKVVSYQILTVDSHTSGLTNERLRECKDQKMTEIWFLQSDDIVDLITPIYINRLRSGWCLRSGFTKINLHSKYQPHIMRNKTSLGGAVTFVQDCSKSMKRKNTYLGFLYKQEMNLASNALYHRPEAVILRIAFVY